MSFWFSFALIALSAGTDTDYRLLFLGDSLTAGYGLKPREAHPALIEEAFLKAGLKIDVINGGVSGDTTAGGLRRLEWMLRVKPRGVVIALGANDMLRGIPVEKTKENLNRMIEVLKNKNVDVFLLGMKALPNYGPDYEKNFNKIYSQIAHKHRVPLFPFYIERVAAQPSLNLQDGIHPNRDGQKMIAEDVFRFLLPELRQILEKK
jgi:acyl-CoA thioesterase-1